MSDEKKRILIVDDDENFCNLTSYLLKKNNYSVDSIYSGDLLMDKLNSTKYDLVLLDIKIGDQYGLDYIPKIREFDKDIVIVMCTEIDSAAIAVEAIKKGAYDYLTKSMEDDKMLLKISHAIDKHNDLLEIKKLKDALSEHFSLGNLVGINKKMQDIYILIKKICDKDTTVLICGETGCGKELIAKAIHFNSLRRDNPFVAVNCAAISENLMESELFGHEKGAFTGAYAQKKGKIEVAHTGALFLDEIGDMSINLQAKLLRFLQDKTFERVGGTKKLTSDLRVIAATNKDLPHMIKDNTFREDLFYRINAIQIKVPPLRERLDDLDLLIEYFIKRSNIKHNHNIKKISKALLKKMTEYPWPGNIRELENLIDRLVLLAEDNKISEEQAFSYLEEQTHPAQEAPIDLDVSLKEARGKFENTYITNLLKKYYGNIKLAAEKADVDRRIIYEKMKKYNIAKEDFRKTSIKSTPGSSK